MKKLLLAILISLPVIVIGQKDTVFHADSWERLSFSTEKVHSLTTFYHTSPDGKNISRFNLKGAEKDSTRTVLGASYGFVFDTQSEGHIELFNITNDTLTLLPTIDIRPNNKYNQHISAFEVGSFKYVKVNGKTYELREVKD